MKFRAVLTVLSLLAISHIGPNGPASAQTGSLPPVDIPFGYSLVKRSRDRSGHTTAPSRASRRPPAEQISEEEVVKVETVLVGADVLVEDGSGKPVSGLTQSDFQIFEDDVQQEVAMFARSGELLAVPRTIVLVIDHSSSQLPYLKNSIEAAKMLVDQLGPNDRLAIVSDDVELLTNFTSDKQVLRSVLDGLRDRTFEGNLGKSSQYSALMATLNELFRGDELRPTIIFQTDGDELPKSAASKKSASFTYERILEAAARSGVTLYSVYPGRSFLRVTGSERVEVARADFEAAERIYTQVKLKRQYNPRAKVVTGFLEKWADARSRDEEAISRLAELTGGFAQVLESPERASEVYRNILANMSDRYFIGYYPAGEVRDGKSRRLKVVVRGRDKYTVRGRTSYTPRDGNR